MNADPANRGYAVSAPALLINGEWRDVQGRKTIDVVDPSDGSVVNQLPAATRGDLDDALAAAAAAFPAWAARTAYERAAILRSAAAKLRERVAAVSVALSIEQGKPLQEAAGEILNGADILEWFADEGRRAYGRVIPSRFPGASAIATREPIGPVAAFSPWNFPVSQAARKLGAALAAGCTIILKGPEEAPTALCEVVRALVEAGVPAGAVNLIFGTPAEISSYLIPSPVIRKVSFTGSVPVGKHLAAMAGAHMKPATMELGGHSPVLVFADCDLNSAVTQLATFKHRNAGQVCISPTRFFIENAVYDEFVKRYLDVIGNIKLGPGLDPATGMGPLATARRVDAVSDLVNDALADGATLLAGGQRIGNTGYFYAPTALGDVPNDSRIMVEEPFGPVAILNRFGDEEDALASANNTAFGLAAYAYTGSAARAHRLGSRLQAGMVSINHPGLGPVETPFGGVKDSGHGREGGSEGLDAYLVTKFISQVFA